MAVLNSAFSLFATQTLAPAITGGVAAPGKMWHLLILKVFSFVADYGWRIVVFTILLKLVLSPLDFFQRYKLHKNQKITERLKPTMEKIQKQYGNDKQAFSQKQMELNRKEGYSYFASCLPMIATLVVFITLWISMQTIAEYMTFKEYTTLYDEYQYVYSQIYDEEQKGYYADPQNPTEEEALLVQKKKEAAIAAGQNVVYQMYYYGLDEGYITKLRADPLLTEYSEQIPSDLKLMRDGTKSVKKVQASFLWIKNIWAPDVPWGDQAVLSWDAFYKGVDDYRSAGTSGLKKADHEKCFNSNMYKEVMGKLLSDKSHSKTNGYLILPILVVLLSLGSQFLSMFQNKKAGQVNAKGGTAMSVKVMMVIMPIMMAIFAINYASIFALYMVLNSAMSLLLNFVFSFLLKFIDKVKQNRNYGIATGRAGASYGSNSPIIHYVKGANPNAGQKEPPQTSADKKEKKKPTQGAAVQKSGRPDPNALMGVDMSNKNKKK